MKNFINKNLNKEKDGFTIIETLVAITILMIAIAGPLTIAQKSLMASIYARDQVIASYLAQDGMEYMLNQRDISSFETWLNDGVQGIKKCTELHPCVIDSYGGGFILPTTDSSYYDLYTEGNGIYYPNPVSSATPIPTASGVGTSKTIFSRKFYVDTTNISNIDPNTLKPIEATFVVLVEWSNGTIDNQVKLQSQVFKIKL